MRSLTINGEEYRCIDSGTITIVDIRGIYYSPESFKEIPPGTVRGRAVWVVQEWMPHPLDNSKQTQARAGWRCPEGYELSFEDGDFDRPVCKPK